MVFDDVTVENLKEKSLELTIWDYDKLSSNDFLGSKSKYWLARNQELRDMSSCALLLQHYRNSTLCVGLLQSGHNHHHRM
jgi:hypothetical protein